MLSCLSTASLAEPAANTDWTLSAQASTGVTHFLSTHLSDPREPSHEQTVGDRKDGRSKIARPPLSMGNKTRRCGLSPAFNWLCSMVMQFLVEHWCTQWIGLESVLDASGTSLASTFSLGSCVSGKGKAQKHQNVWHLVHVDKRLMVSNWSEDSHYGRLYTVFVCMEMHLHNRCIS